MNSCEPKRGSPLLRIIICVTIILMATLAQAQSSLQTDNVILVTLDGLRWQELFDGADESLIGNEAYVDDADLLKARFWDDDAETRRKLLMPFFWSVIAKQGQLHGNRVHGSQVNLTNNFWFSYPGYNEILTGFRDDLIDSNDKIENSNVTVLEYIHRRPEFDGSVAVFGSWDVFPYIINEQRSRIPVNAGFDLAVGDDLTAREKFLNELQPQVPSPWPTVRLDAFTHHYAKEYIEKNSPRLTYIAYGETDDFAHDGEYDQYLNSAHQTDAFIGDIWNWVQSNAKYRDTTTMIITTDHGRGTQPVDTWKDHGTEVDGSDQIWFAVIGPDTEPLGELKESGQFYQNQIAGTVAAFLGIDYDGDGRAGELIDGVIER
jgi:hypothetical protein